MNVLEKWIDSYQNNVYHRKLQKDKLERINGVVIKFNLKKSFEKIRSESEKIQTKII